MPEQNSHGIEVSKAEERYLRSAFRRFALPYVLVFAAVSWAAATVMAKDGRSSSGEEISALRKRVAGLEQSLAALEGRVGRVGSELEHAVNRLGALEKGRPGERAASSDLDALESELRDAAHRIADLERRDAEGARAAERIDALAARMQRIEAIARSAAQPAPASPAPAPAP